MIFQANSMGVTIFKAELLRIDDVITFQVFKQAPCVYDISTDFVKSHSKPDLHNEAIYIRGGIGRLDENIAEYVCLTEDIAKLTHSFFSNKLTEFCDKVEFEMGKRDDNESDYIYCDIVVKSDSQLWVILNDKLKINDRHNHLIFDHNNDINKKIMPLYFMMNRSDFAGIKYSDNSKWYMMLMVKRDDILVSTTFSSDDNVEMVIPNRIRFFNLHKKDTL